MGQSKEQLEKKYDDCVELHRQWYIEYHTTNGKTDRRRKNLCNNEMENLRIEIRVIEKELSMVDKITELEKENTDLKLQVKFLHEGLLPVGELNDTLQLEEYRKLQSEVHLGIERVWSIDSYDYSTNPYDVKERSEIIEEIFYKIGNEWIGGDNPAQLQKRTDPQRWESLDDMDGSWTEDDIEKGNHLPF